MKIKMAILGFFAAFAGQHAHADYWNSYGHYSQDGASLMNGYTPDSERKRQSGKSDNDAVPLRNESNHNRDQRTYPVQVPHYGLSRPLEEKKPPAYKPEGTVIPRANLTVDELCPIVNNAVTVFQKLESALGAGDELSIVERAGLSDRLRDRSTDLAFKADFQRSTAPYFSSDERLYYVYAFLPFKHIPLKTRVYLVNNTIDYLGVKRVNGYLTIYNRDGTDVTDVFSGCPDIQ